MPLYVSKPSRVEAIQWTGENYGELQEALGEKVHKTAGLSLMLLAGKDGAQEFVPVPEGHWLVHAPGDLSDIWPVETSASVGMAVAAFGSAFLARRERRRQEAADAARSSGFVASFDQIQQAVEEVAVELGGRFVDPLRVAGRVLARLEAMLGHWFWLPCPVCGEAFGGQEVSRLDSNLPNTVPDMERRGCGWVICPSCTVDGYGYPLDVELEIWSAAV